MWIFDSLSLAFLEVNEAAVRIYGYSKEEFLAMTIKDIRPAENLVDIDPAKIRIQATNTTTSRHNYKNGELIDVEVTSFPFRFNGREGRLAYVRDVTTKKKREYLLEYLNMAGEELGLTLDTASAIEKISKLIVPGFANWFTINLLKGESLDLLFIKNEDPGYEKWAVEHRKRNPLTVHDTGMQGQILRTGESFLVPVVTEEMLTAAVNDKEQLDVIRNMNLRSSIAVPMKIRSRIIGTVNFISTIEGKQYDQIDLDFAKDFATRIALTLENARLHEDSQRELEQRILAENKKDEFIGVASHELKTPMTTINASVQMLDRIFKKEPSSASIPKLIETTKKSLAKLSGLIVELLNVSKIEAGQLRLNKQTFKLSQVLTECCEHVNLIETHTLFIEGDLDLEVFADPQRIDQVVVNFINNAVKYSPISQEIRFFVEKADGHAKLSVTDQGIGISKEKLPYIFDRYYRVDNSGIQFSGLGLGLYISSEIIKMHGGEIGVSSEVGKGSTFWFTIPLG